jgi:hypothetical protein
VPHQGNRSEAQARTTHATASASEATTAAAQGTAGQENQTPDGTRPVTKTPADVQPWWHILWLAPAVFVGTFVICVVLEVLRSEYGRWHGLRLVLARQEAMK